MWMDSAKSLHNKSLRRPRDCDSRGTAERRRGELSLLEQKIFSKLEAETERAPIRIFKNFDRRAAGKNEADFPFPIQHVAHRLALSFQHVSKLRQRFVDSSIIVETAPFMTNRSAARFRWVPSKNVAPGLAIGAFRYLSELIRSRNLQRIYAGSIPAWCTFFRFWTLEVRRCHWWTNLFSSY